MNAHLSILFQNTENVLKKFKKKKSENKILQNFLMWLAFTWYQSQTRNYKKKVIPIFLGDKNIKSITNIVSSQFMIIVSYTDTQVQNIVCLKCTVPLTAKQRIWTSQRMCLVGAVSCCPCPELGKMIVLLGISFGEDQRASISCLLHMCKLLQHFKIGNGTLTSHK